MEKNVRLVNGNGDEKYVTRQVANDRQALADHGWREEVAPIAKNNQPTTAKESSVSDTIEDDFSQLDESSVSTGSYDAETASEAEKKPAKQTKTK